MKLLKNTSSFVRRAAIAAAATIAAPPKKKSRRPSAWNRQIRPRPFYLKIN